MTEAKNWTIAYRNPKASTIRRVTNWSGTWDEALRMAGEFLARNTGLQVWYVTTREAELSGYVPVEDIGNVLVNSGKRVRITDNGALPDNLLDITL